MEEKVGMGIRCEVILRRGGIIIDRRTVGYSEESDFIKKLSGVAIKALEEKNV